MSLKRKLVVVGDGDCGKTCILIAFTKNSFDPDVYAPTVCENYVEDVQIGEETVELNLEDTAGNEDYDRLRPLQYTDCNVFLLCFSVVNRTSFDNVQHKWIPEIRHFCPGVPILLIGTKVDLRIDPSTLEKLRRERKPPVRTQEAEQVAKKIGAVRYMECSAKTKFNVKEVFLEAANSTLTVKKRNKKKACSLI